MQQPKKALSAQTVNKTRRTTSHSHLLGRSNMLQHAPLLTYAVNHTMQLLVFWAYDTQGPTTSTEHHFPKFHVRNVYWKITNIPLTTSYDLDVG
mmetsp:Transcript_15637/g.25938  ORF Transcript_15637/g.25938 Transcript_15637/m.25938 type:complete len:94 (-) Transcript_15637:1365-1646(-)